MGAGQSSAGGSRDCCVHSGEKKKTTKFCQPLTFDSKKKYSYSTAATNARLCVFAQGRLIDHVKKKATSLQRVTYLVFDEADRMFDMGFGGLALSEL